MAGIILSFYGKFTTLVGAGNYYSDPFDVTGQKNVDVETLLVASIGSPTTVNAYLEGSSDLQTWTTLTGPNALTAGTVDTLSKSSPPRYVRVRIQITGGTNPAVTLWSKGIARDA